MNKRFFGRRLVFALALTWIVLIGCSRLVAQTSANSSIPSDRIAQLEQQVKAAQSSADNAWMLVSSALVLMMTGPGLALFYGGLVRKKNVLATMLQSFAMMALVTVLWAIIGYSLSFSSGTSFIG
ncbi:MAG TPA: ammonia channel protein, partial [Terriglobales bacterium]|nr:ammonia channel protein [Terriglobales bacterium]